MTFEDAPDGGSERSAALDGWVAAFDREIDKSGDFAASVAAMTAHGCFDVRAVVERWILANPTGEVVLAPVQPVRQEHVPLQAVPEEDPAAEETPASDETVARAEPALEAERVPPRLVAASSPDIAYFHSLLQGGIERAQIDEAFPGFRPVIDEAVSQCEAAAPILSDVPPGPSRDDLNGEIRDMRQEFQAPGKSGRRRWRDRG